MEKMTLKEAIAALGKLDKSTLIAIHKGDLPDPEEKSYYLLKHANGYDLCFRDGFTVIYSTGCV